MNNEDRRLVHFLQHHKPAPPPAPPQAEAQLLQALDALPPGPRFPLRLSAGALLGLAAAGLMTGWWIGQRRAIALAEAQRLEATLVEEWMASLALSEDLYVEFLRNERP